MLREDGDCDGLRVQQEQTTVSNILGRISMIEWDGVILPRITTPRVGSFFYYIVSLILCSC